MGGGREDIGGEVEVIVGGGIGGYRVEGRQYL